MKLYKAAGTDRVAPLADHCNRVGWSHDFGGGEMPLVEREAILHIGMEKTGTTSIQHVLARRRQDLLKLGFAFPASPGRSWQLDSNHHALAMFGIGELTPRSADLFQIFGPTMRPEAALAEFESQFRIEMGFLPETVHTVIFSSEFLQSRLVDVRGIQRLKALLGEYFVGFRIFIYLRRQDLAAASLYTTALRNGRCPSIIPAANETDFSFYDYKRVLDRWAEVFGEDAVEPAIFSRSALAGGDVVVDFFQRSGLDKFMEPPHGRLENAAISGTAQAVLRQFNLFFEGQQSDASPDELSRMRWALGRLANERFPGPAMLPLRAEAEAFLNRFRETNEAVRARWFPGQPILFDDDFSKHPSAAVDAATAENSAATAMMVLLHDLLREHVRRR